MPYRAVRGRNVKSFEPRRQSARWNKQTVISGRVALIGIHNLVLPYVSDQTHSLTQLIFTYFYYYIVFFLIYYSRNKKRRKKCSRSTLLCGLFFCPWMSHEYGEIHFCCKRTSLLLTVKCFCAHALRHVARGIGGIFSQGGDYPETARQTLFSFF